MTGCLRCRSKKSYTVNKGNKPPTVSSTNGETSGLRPTSYQLKYKPDEVTTTNGTAIKPSAQVIPASRTLSNPPKEKKEPQLLPINNAAHAPSSTVSNSTIITERPASPKPVSSILVTTSTSQASDINRNPSLERRRSSRVSFSEPEATVLNKTDVEEYSEVNNKDVESTEIVEQIISNNENNTTESPSTIKRKINIIEEVEEINDVHTESKTNEHQTQKSVETEINSAQNESSIIHNVDPAPQVQEVVTKVTVHRDQNGYKENGVTRNENVTSEANIDDTKNHTIVEDKHDNNQQEVTVATVVKSNKQNTQESAKHVENGYKTDTETKIKNQETSHIQNEKPIAVVINKKTYEEPKQDLQYGRIEQNKEPVGFVQNGEHKNMNGEISPRISAVSNEAVVNDPPKQSINETPQRRDGVAPQPLHLDEEKTIKVFPKDPDDEKLIRQAIEQNDFLSRIIRENVMDDIVAAMYNKEIAPKEIIIKQGDKGSHMYVSARGRYQILVKGKVVQEFTDVRVFGELAILYNDNRRATIKALTAGRVWVLDQSVYQYIVYRYNIREQDEILSLLLNNRVLNVAKEEVLRSVANLLKKEFFQAGQHIVKQGEKGNKFYIIRAGNVTVTKENEGVVNHYNKGDCFGELALLHEDSRQATVTAEPPGVECLTLARKDFLNNFEELDSWEKLKPSYKPRQTRNSSVLSINEFSDMDINDLKIKATIGVGGFGRVELVQHTKDKNKVFALKYLKKIDIVMQHQEEHVYNEKKVQKSSTSPFIVRLYKTYKDDKYIYFLMEACLGGDLWSLLQKQKNRRFDEKDARFICGCVLEAFDYLHSKGIIYRDLKPENLLIDANGYIKLTDFGFAKQMTPRGKTFTFAGTPEYVGPEIVLNRGHDRAVDYWAYGCFVYEMLTGRTPFRTDDSSHMRTYNRILSGIDNIVFPSYITQRAKHLVEKLCRPIPAERLGMQKGGVKDIKGHRWYLGFDWQKLINLEIPSPFKPKLKSPIDTSYFDKFKKDDDVPPDEKSGWDKNF